MANEHSAFPLQHFKRLPQQLNHNIAALLKCKSSFKLIQVYSGLGLLSLRGGVPPELTELTLPVSYLLFNLSVIAKQRYLSLITAHDLNKNSFIDNFHS